jgi:tRNA G18 (ribose-2'-O)-methylase SpoU
MLQVQHITSLDHPELQPYRTMRRQMDHRQQGIFVAEGEKVVRRLLESHFTVNSALLPQKWFEELKPLLEKRQESIRVFIAEKKLLETLTGFSMYQGLLAVGKIPPLPTVEAILAGSGRPHLLVAVDSLSSAENMGAVVRNCAAFGAQALIVGETCSSPYLRRAVRSSMGAVFQLPIVEPPSLAETLRQLRSCGLRCIAAHPHAEQRYLPEADLLTDCCLVFGSEGYGISPEVLSVCDEEVAIEMAATVDSLNVASAAAVFLYETSRQRKALHKEVRSDPTSRT